MKIQKPLLLWLVKAQAAPASGTRSVRRLMNSSGKAMDAQGKAIKGTACIASPARPGRRVSVMDLEGSCTTIRQALVFVLQDPRPAGSMGRTVFQKRQRRLRARAGLRLRQSRNTQTPPPCQHGSTPPDRKTDSLQTLEPGERTLPQKEQCQQVLR